MGKGLVVVGLAVAALGALLMAGLPLGRLPGDLVFRRGGATIYLPLGTCLLVSVGITLLSLWWRR